MAFNLFNRRVALLAVMFYSVFAAAEDTPLSLAVPPGNDAMQTQHAYEPIAAYLSQRLQRTVTLNAPAQFETFWQGVVEKRFDIVHYNAYLYVTSHQDYGYDAILKNKVHNAEGATSVVAVSKASGIRRVDQIKGRPILFGGGPKAMVGYVVPRYLLASEGLLPGSYQEKFLPEASAEGAQPEQVATAEGAQVVATWLNRLDQSQWRVLLSSEPMAVEPWAVKKDMPAQTRETLQSTLMELNTTESGRAMLRAAHIEALAEADDHEFDPHRAMASQVGTK